MKRILALLSLAALLAIAGCANRGANVAPPPPMPQPPSAAQELKVSFGFGLLPRLTKEDVRELPVLEVSPFPAEDPPRPWECQSGLGETFLDAAERLLSDGSPGEAITCCQEALPLVPDEDKQKARFLLAQSYALAGLPVNAERELRVLASQKGETYPHQARVILIMYDRLSQRSKDEIRRLENALKKLIDATGRPPR